MSVFSSLQIGYYTGGLGTLDRSTGLLHIVDDSGPEATRCENSGSVGWDGVLIKIERDD